MSITQLVDLYWIWRPEQYWNSGYKHLLEKHYCMKKKPWCFFYFWPAVFAFAECDWNDSSKRILLNLTNCETVKFMLMIDFIVYCRTEENMSDHLASELHRHFHRTPRAALAKSCHPWVYFPYPIKWKLTAHLFGAMGSRTCCLWCHNNVIGSISEHSHTAINRLISFRCTNELRCAFY